MNLYRYDGSAEGLLSAISHILRHEHDPATIGLRKQEQMLFDEGVFIATDPGRAEELIRRFSRAFPRNAMDLLYCIYAEKDGMETALLHYIHLVARHGSGVRAYLTHPDVHDVQLLAKKVGHEVHRFQGLLRFALLEDGSYLARMEPDFNIIQPLSRFFCRRLAAQNWFIYDVRRSLVSSWDRHSLEFGTLESFRTPEFSEEEHEVRQLWKTFFRHVSIPDRKNDRLQKSCMPMKYWKYLVEKSS